MPEYIRLGQAHAAATACQSSHAHLVAGYINDPSLIYLGDIRVYQCPSVVSSVWVAARLRCVFGMFRGSRSFCGIKLPTNLPLQPRAC